MSHESIPQTKETTLEPASEVVFPADIDINALTELHKTQDDRFDVLLDDMAYDLIFENDELKSEFVANLTILRGHAAEPEKKQAAERNRAIFASAKELILQRAGIVDVIVDEIEHAKLQISKIISDDQKQHGTEADALVALGILSQDEEGVERFSYPRDLMPSSTNEKWHEYLKSVKAHVIAADQHDSKGTIMALDHARRYAHNTIARDVQALLGFDDSDEGFEEARKLVAKMRENRFPTIDTAERDRVEAKVQKGMGGSVLAILRRHSSELYDPERRSGH